MPYEIGRAFSGDVWNTLNRSRDRAAANPGLIRKTSKVETGLAEAMIRAQQDERENQTRRDLGLAGLDVERERANATANLGYAELDRKAAADAAQEDRLGKSAQAMGDYRSGMLEARKKEVEGNGARYAAQIDYQKGMLDVRQKEAAAHAAMAQAAQDAQALRAEAHAATDERQALAALGSLKARAFKPNKYGEIPPEQIQVYAHELNAMLDLFLRQKNMTRSSGAIEKAASSIRQQMAQAQGIGGVDEGDELDSGDQSVLDFVTADGGATDQRQTPPRLGR